MAERYEESGDPGRLKYRRNPAEWVRTNLLGLLSVPIPQPQPKPALPSTMSGANKSHFEHYNANQNSAALPQPPNRMSLMSNL